MTREQQVVHFRRSAQEAGYLQKPPKDLENGSWQDSPNIFLNLRRAARGIGLRQSFEWREAAPLSRPLAFGHP